MLRHGGSQPRKEEGASHPARRGRRCRSDRRASLQTRLPFCKIRLEDNIGRIVAEYEELTQAPSEDIGKTNYYNGKISTKDYIKINYDILSKIKIEPVVIFSSTKELPF